MVSSASTRLLAATTLRNVLGMRDLAQLLSDREAISHMMQANLDVATDPWGVEVERVEMYDSLFTWWTYIIVFFLLNVAPYKTHTKAKFLSNCNF